MRQTEKERKKFLVPNFIHSRLGQENSAKNSKKIQKIIKLLLGIIFSQNRIRQAKEMKTKFQSRILFILDPGKKIPKKIVKNSKNYKTPSWNYFQPKRDEIGRKSENKILVPISVHTQPGQENSEKNSKKIQKIIKPLDSYIFSQNGMRSAEKKKTKFKSRIPFILDPGMKIPKEIVKKF